MTTRCGSAVAAFWSPNNSVVSRQKGHFYATVPQCSATFKAGGLLWRAATHSAWSNYCGTVDQQILAQHWHWNTTLFINFLLQSNAVAHWHLSTALPRLIKDLGHSTSWYRQWSEALLIKLWHSTGWQWHSCGTVGRERQCCWSNSNICRLRLLAHNSFVQLTQSRIEQKSSKCCQQTGTNK